MVIEHTPRGLAVVTFEDTYGMECSLQKSSSIEDRIWFGINDCKPKIMAIHADEAGVKTNETTGWVPYPIPPNVLLSTRMHLSQSQVIELLPYLTKFAETGNI